MMEGSRRQEDECHFLPAAEMAGAPNLALSAKTLTSDILPIFTSQPLADNAQLLTDIQPDVSTKAEKVTRMTIVKRPRVLGVLQIICGLLLIVVNISGLTLLMDTTAGALGIGSGVFATVTGCFGIRLSRKSTNELASLFMIFSTVSLIIAGCVIGFTVPEATKDWYYVYDFVPTIIYSHNRVVNVSGMCRYVLAIVSCCLALAEIIIALMTVVMTCGTICRYGPAEEVTEKTTVKRPRVLGVLQIICGLLLIVVNISGLTLFMDTTAGALGIAGGVFATVTGCFGIRLSRKSTNELASLFMIFSTVSLIIAGCVIGFTVPEATNDWYYVYDFVPTIINSHNSVVNVSGMCRYVLAVVSCCLALAEIIIALMTVVMTCGTICRYGPANQASGSILHQNPASSAAIQVIINPGSVGANCSVSCFCPSCGTHPDLSKE